MGSLASTQKTKAAALLTGLVLWIAAGAAWSQSALGPIRLDNWGYCQKNANGSNQWQLSAVSVQLR